MSMNKNKTVDYVTKKNLPNPLQLDKKVLQKVGQEKRRLSGDPFKHNDDLETISLPSPTPPQLVSAEILTHEWLLNNHSASYISPSVPLQVGYAAVAG